MLVFLFSFPRFQRKPDHCTCAWRSWYLLSLGDNKPPASNPESYPRYISGANPFVPRPQFPTTPARRRLDRRHFTRIIRYLKSQIQTESATRPSTTRLARDMWPRTRATTTTRCTSRSRVWCCSSSRRWAASHRQRGAHRKARPQLRRQGSRGPHQVRRHAHLHHVLLCAPLADAV